MAAPGKSEQLIRRSVSTSQHGAQQQSQLTCIEYKTHFIATANLLVNYKDTLQINIKQTMQLFHIFAYITVTHKENLQVQNKLIN
jgi:hypothetical protein